MSVAMELREIVRLDLDDWVECVRPDHSGARVAIGSTAGDALVADGEGCILRRFATGGSGVIAIDWSHDDRYLAVGYSDGSVTIVDVDTPTHRAATMAASGWLSAVAWGPADHLLGVALDRRVGVVGPDGLEPRWSSRHPSTVTDLAWSDDGSRIGAATYGGVYWWLPDALESPARVMEWKGSLLSLSVAPSGRWIAAGCQDSSVHVWKLWSGEDLQMAGYPSKVDRTAWDSSSTLLAVGNPDEITVWSFAGKGPQGTMPKVLEGPQGRVHDLAFAPTGDHLASTSKGGRLCVHAAGHSAQVATWDAADVLTRVGWLAGGSRVVVGSAGGTVTWLELAEV
jgi:WD40 repeat protein